MSTNSPFSLAILRDRSNLARLQAAATGSNRRPQQTHAGRAAERSTRRADAHPFLRGTNMRKFVIPSLIVLAYCLPAHAVWTLTNDQQAAAPSVTFSNALTNPSIIIAVCRSRYISYNTGAHDSAGNTYVDSGLGSFDTGLLPTDRPRFRVMTASNTQTTANDVITCDDADGTTWTSATEFTGGSSLVDGVIGIVTRNHIVGSRLGVACGH